MTGVGDNPRDLYEYIRETRRRLVALERRQPPDVTAFPKTGGSAAERDAYYGTPIDNSQRALLANKEVWWFNTDFGWAESYYAVTGLTGLTAKGLIAGTTSGWYPIGLGPYMILEPTTTFSASAGASIGNWNGSVRRNGGAAWFGSGSTGIDFVQTGRYDFGWWTNQAAGSGTADYHTRLRNAADTVTDWLSNASGTTLVGAIFTRTGADYHGQIVRVGQQLKVYVQSASLAVHNVTTGTAQPPTRGEMWTRYVGPALVSD